jgi:hypothetical protein
LISTQKSNKRLMAGRISTQKSIKRLMAGMISTQKSNKRLMAGTMTGETKREGQKMQSQEESKKGES